MQIEKILNNNVVQALDNNVEYIVMGKGLGFQKKGGDLVDKEKIEKKISSSVEEYERGAIYMRNNPILLLKVTVLTLVQISLLYAVPYVVYRGFGLSGYTIMDLILMQAILNIAVSSLPLPGGVGASESLFLSMFMVFYGKKLLVPGMLLTRISNFYSVLVISGIISLIMYLWPSKKEVREGI